MEKELKKPSERELGIYVIKRLYEMGFSEEQILAILKKSLYETINEKLSAEKYGGITSLQGPIQYGRAQRPSPTTDGNHP